MKIITCKQYPEAGIGLLRISFGLMLVLAHGWPTLKGFLEGTTDPYPDPLGMGSYLTMGLMVFTEFFCALLVTLGVFTRWSLIPIVIGFSVAFFVHHANDPFGYKELSFHYLLVFVILFISGPGKFTLMSFIRKR
jgi:putative oxidoreductase